MRTKFFRKLWSRRPNFGPPDQNFCWNKILRLISSFPCAGVSFWLRGTAYQNNSLVTLEDIGEGDDALLCVTDLTACCRPPYTDPLGSGAIGNWFFPNGTRVPSSSNQWDIYRVRSGPGLIYLHHRRERRGGGNGIYRCVIPDAMQVIRTICIGVYSADAGEYITIELALYHSLSYI